MELKITKVTHHHRLRPIHPKQDTATLSFHHKVMATFRLPSSPLLHSLGMDIKEDTTQVHHLLNNMAVDMDMAVIHRRTNHHLHSRTVIMLHLHHRACLLPQAQHHNNLAMEPLIATLFSTATAPDDERPF